MGVDKRGNTRGQGRKERACRGDIGSTMMRKCKHTDRQKDKEIVKGVATMVPKPLHHGQCPAVADGESVRLQRLGLRDRRG